MPRRKTPFIPGYYYHIYNRGHDRGNIFIEPANYEYFLRQFKKYIAHTNAEVITYVLMPNHYHFLLRIITAEFSTAMKNLSISYVRAMNKRYDRSGTLFQGSFQSKLIEKEEYLIYLSRYIHLNPVSAGLVKTPEEWIYSSYKEYIGQRKGTLPKPEIVLDYFKTSKDSDLSHKYRRYQEFVLAISVEEPKEIARVLFD